MKPDPKLIDSMAMRYRHDFGLLDQNQKDSIRTTMTQIWEEVVGLGFYKTEKTITPNPKLKSIIKYVVKTYLDDGRIFKYEVDSAEKVREHASAIVKDGYRHNDGKVFEHYPPHRILKVKSENIPTNYPDTVEGT